MSEVMVSFAMVLLLVSGIPGLFFRPRSPWIGISSGIFTTLGALFGLFGAILGIIHPDFSLLPFPWPVFPQSMLGLDPLGAFFMVPVFLIGGLGSIYALAYWSPRAKSRTAARIRFFWGMTLGGMILLLMSRQGVLFLLGWETMALGAFFLIATEDEKEQTRKSALVYLVATHVGTLALFGFFSLWKSCTGSFDLSPVLGGSIPAGTANILFLIALFGFGLKAGLMPLHFWLPGAHANAPSHVSALLSGVMLKMGIYGIIRVAFLLPGISPFWGFLVLVLGALSGLLGVAFALAQHDLKRLLAYHSVENIGIILLGLALALLGRSYNRNEWVVLGLAGCLLHVWNHSIFKSLLFLGAGSVLHGTGTRLIDRLGGLGRSMPLTAGTFLVGAVAISGLPPLNGFISELFIYLGFFKSAFSVEKIIFPALLGAPALAMIGALAVACFVKVFSVVFLGSPRSQASEQVHEAPGVMILPMIFLALLCGLIGFVPGITVPFLENPIDVWTSSSLGKVPPINTLVPLGFISQALLITLGLFILGAFLTVVLKKRFSQSKAPSVGTWDCGYAAPTARMQYTAGSLARSVVGLFRWVVGPQDHGPRLRGAFPKTASLESHVDDLILDRLLVPDFRVLRDKARWFYKFQQGLTHWYVLYLVVILGLLFMTLVPFRDIFFQTFTQ